MVSLVRCGGDARAACPTSWSPAGRSATRADQVGERELTPEAVALARADAEVGAGDGHAVGLGQSGAGLPAVAELLLLVA
jgi:hypothetical protein